MQKRAIYIIPALCLGLCTACSVPEPETWESPDPTTAAVTTEAITETLTAATAPVNEPDSTDAADETGETDESGTAEETEPPEDTEETTEEIKHYPWQDAYASVLSAKVKAGGYEEGCFTLLSLDDDNIPELILMMDVYMELYRFDGTKAELLLEEAFRGMAIENENVCYRPGTGMLAIRFDTMGGGKGFVVGMYEQLDRTAVDWYRFNYDDLGSDGEIPHNKAWDNAETLDVVLTEENQILLGDSWSCIDEEFAGMTELTEKSAAQVGEAWQPEIETTADTTESAAETPAEEQP